LEKVRCNIVEEEKHPQANREYGVGGECYREALISVGSNCSSGSSNSRAHMYKVSQINFVTK